MEIYLPIAGMSINFFLVLPKVLLRIIAMIN